MKHGSDKLDMVVFGATGFTGKHVVKELIALKAGAPSTSFTFGIAGRNIAKLSAILDELADKDNSSLIRDVEILEADVKDPGSLKQMASRTKVILDCVGPYYLYGEPVVEACIEARTDYVDVSGEPAFIEKMYYKYHQKAVDSGVLVISACGFDSIPADLGVLHAISQLDPDVKVSSIESFMECHYENVRINYGTYESLVGSFGAMKDLSHTRTLIHAPALETYGPKLKLKLFPHYDTRINKYTMPFGGSDASVVKRTQSLLSESEKPAYTPTQYAAYFCVQSFHALLLFLFFGSIFAVCASFEWGRRLLLAYPSIFTLGIVRREPPSPRDIERASFSVTFYTTALGKDKDTEKMLLVTRVNGPECGYVTTPICITQSALSILEMRKKSSKKSGVLTPGAAFYGTDMIQRLSARGVQFSLLGKRRA